MLFNLSSFRIDGLVLLSNISLKSEDEANSTVAFVVGDGGVANNGSSGDLTSVTLSIAKSMFNFFRENSFVFYQVFVDL